MKENTNLHIKTIRLTKKDKRLIGELQKWQNRKSLSSSRPMRTPKLTIYGATINKNDPKTNIKIIYN